jgi:general secretion pathway protein D
LESISNAPNTSKGLVTIFPEADEAIPRRSSACDGDIRRASDDYAINHVWRGRVENGRGQNIYRCATIRRFGHCYDPSRTSIVLREITNHHELVAMNPWEIRRYSARHNHALKIVGESCSNENGDSECEKWKKIFHGSGECNVSKHFILTTRSRAMSSLSLTFVRAAKPKHGLTRNLASVNIVATITSVHRSVLLLAVASSGFAQVAPVAQPAKTPPVAGQPARPAPSVPQVVALPVAAAQTPAPIAPPPAAKPNPRAGAPQMVQLQFPNSDVADVLRFYEQLTGKKLVMDNFVQGKVNIFIAKEVPREEAVKIIEMNLLLNGYSLVPSEDSDIVKVIGTGKNPRTSGVPIISDETEIPEGDHVISYLFKLRYADPQELQQALGQYLSPPQPYTSFLALPKAGAILVTENSSVIRTLARIINQVDVPPAEVVSEFIKLERADATKVCDMLKDIFEKGEKTGTTGGVRGVRSGGVPNVPPPAVEVSEVGGLAALTEESVVVGKIKLSPDVRTNRIHVITRPVNMPFIRRLISQFDANVEFAKPVTRALNYISASDALPVIVQALTEPGQAAPGAEGAQPAPGASATPSRRTTTYAGTTTGTTQTSTTGSTTAGTGGGTLNISEELSTQPVDTRPNSVTVGNAKIIADPRANTIIMLGDKNVVVKVQEILDELDVKAPQVALSTVIGELTLGDEEEFGADYFVKSKRFVATSRNTGVPLPIANASASPGASPGTTTGSIIDPARLVNFTQIIQNVGAGTNLYVAAGTAFASIVHFLETTGRFRVINRPIVFTSNNKKAIIASGQEVPVPVNTLSTVVSNNVATGNIGQQSNIEFKRIALQLEVVPLINSEREVSLDILQKLDSISGSTIINGNSIPTIATRYVRTNVTAPNGSTIILGGLITDNKRKDTTGMPYLSRIPYLGALFRHTTSNNMRTELIVLMCPEVTMTKLEMLKLREKVEDHTHFGPEIDQGYCPDCPPKAIEEKQLPSQLPPPDLPFGKPTTKTK